MPFYFNSARASITSQGLNTKQIVPFKAINSVSNGKLATHYTCCCLPSLHCSNLENELTCFGEESGQKESRKMHPRQVSDLTRGKLCHKQYLESCSKHCVIVAGTLPIHTHKPVLLLLLKRMPSADRLS